MPVTSSDGGYEFEGHRFDPRRGCLLRLADSQTVHLPRRILEILTYLVERSGQTVSRRQLMDALWPDTVVEENSLDRSVSLLRRALGEKPGQRRFIATLHGRGYRFVARVRQPASLPEAGDPTARHLLLHAEALVLRPSEQNIRTAIELLARATKRDPDFARGWSMLAIAHAVCPIWGYVAPGALDEGEAAAHRALELDPRDGAPHTALGLLHAYRGQWQQAERHLDAADALPNEAYLRGLRNSLAWPLGRFRESLEFLGKVHATGRAEPFATQMLAFAHQTLGEDVQTRRYLDEAAALGAPRIAPHPDMEALLAMRAGRYEEAGRLMDECTVLEGRDRQARQAVEAVFSSLAGSTSVAAALARLRRYEQQLRRDRIDPVIRNRMLIWYTALGAAESAHDLADWCLDQYAAAGMVGCAWFQIWLPEMRAFRDHARFRQFTVRMKLPDHSWDKDFD